MTASESGRMLDIDVFEKVRRELRSWPGVTSQPHRFGGTEFQVNGREMGHLHGDQLADLPFPKDIGRKLIEEGRVSPHHVLPESGWISYYINGNKDEDVHNVIELFRMQYNRMTSHVRKQNKSA
jgi:hypothetical protein